MVRRLGNGAEGPDLTAGTVELAALGAFAGEQGRVVDQPRQLVETARLLDDAPRRLPLLCGIVRHGRMDGGFAVAIALSQFGVIALIAKGYGLLAWGFLGVYIAPLLTVGVWRLMATNKQEPAADARP